MLENFKIKMSAWAPQPIPKIGATIIEPAQQSVFSPQEQHTLQTTYKKYVNDDKLKDLMPTFNKQKQGPITGEKAAMDLMRKDKRLDDLLTQWGYIRKVAKRMIPTGDSYTNAKQVWQRAPSTK